VGDLHVEGGHSMVHRLEFGDVDFSGAGPQPPVRLDTLSSLQQFGVADRFKRDEEIYAEGRQAQYWYQVISGTVRLTKLLADGRRHIGRFYFEGDCFGFDLGGARTFSAEAVDDVAVYRYPRQSVGHLINERPQVARQLWNFTLKELAHAQAQTALLGRMTAAMRVSSFLLEVFARRGSSTLLELPMSRMDVADYLGLTVETVCRILSRFAELGLIALPNVRQVELIDTHALETVFLEGFNPEVGQYYGSRSKRPAAGQTNRRRPLAVER
jgi:CRP-like cAMP-binding protein